MTSKRARARAKTLRILASKMEKLAGNDSMGKLRHRAVVLRDCALELAERYDATVFGKK